MSRKDRAKLRKVLERDLLRRRAKDSILAWAQYHDPTYIADPFHVHLAGELDKVVKGEPGYDRVIIQAPPQHGKSRLASVELATHWIAHHTVLPVILVSYGMSLAQRHSREVQERVRSDEFRDVFGPRAPVVKRTHSAVNDWGIQGWDGSDRRGGLKASGVGGDITGRGAGLAIIDDPFKNWREAYSSTIREMVDTWYQSALLTRIWERGAIVLMNTRWHPDDLAGRLMVREPGRWKVLNYPAINEDHLSTKLRGFLPDSLGRQPGEPLAPRRFSKAYLEGLAIHQMVRAAMYQQRPVLAEGGLIPREKFVVLPSRPDDVVHWVRFWDFAATPEGASPDPDFTAGALMGRRANGRFVLADMQHGRWSPAAVEERALSTAKGDGREVRIRIEQEPGSSGVIVISGFIRMLAGWDVAGERATGAQLTRVMPFAAQVDGGNVDLVAGPWVTRFLDECQVYRGDGSTHDDQVVAAAGALVALSDSPAAVGQPAADQNQEDPEVEVTTW